MNKIPIKQIVIVEGKYDKITLENVIDGVIVPCDGFGIFKNEQQKKWLREMADRYGAIILTDSDRAGGVIRSYLNTILQGTEVYTLYVPAVQGKEKRKNAPSKEGYLGVEGISREILCKLFEEFRAEPIPSLIQAKDLYEYGLTGTPDASARKLELLRRLGLPPRISNKALLKELNRRFDPASFKDYLIKN